MKPHPVLRLLSCLALALCSVLPSRAEVIPADRRTVWNPGLNAVGAIPHRTTIYRTLSPSGGDDTAAIQAALDNCPAGQVVQLSPGTFLIGRTPATAPGLVINRSNITLRGSGPDQTLLLQQTDSIYPVVVMGWRWIGKTVGRPLTADGLKGSNTITISDASGLKVGELITLNQLSDDALRDDTNSPVRKVFWGPNAPDPNGGARLWFCELNRPLGQTLEIQSINGNQLTFTTPLHIDFETALDAHVTRFAYAPDGDWNSPFFKDAIKYSGLEDLAVSNGGGGDGGGNIHLWACAYCWVKNVDSKLSGGHSCNLEGSFRCEVRDSYFHETVNPTPGGGGYGIGLNVYSSDCLFENNIVWAFNKLTIGRASGGGNVFGYNYLQDGYGNYYREIMEIGAGPNHYAGSHMELFEGNECFALDSESYWGNAIYATYFRNHATGSRISAPPLKLMDAMNRRAISLATGAWWYNFAGNVLGEANMQLLGQGVDFAGNRFNQRAFAYEVTPANLSDWGASDHPLVPMWAIGVVSSTAFDPVVQARTIRHGNYDYVTKSTIRDPANADHALPDSLYLTSKPAFFGTNPWPWITPETPASPVATLPAKARFEALRATTTFAPLILTQPANQTALSGTTATFTVELIGIPEPAYQWRKNGVAIDGATAASLSLPNVQDADVATYSVITTNSTGTVTSGGATLAITLTAPPAISTQPAGRSVYVGDSVTFTVAATGNPVPTYQWRKNGADLTGSADTSLTLNNVQPSDAGTYSVVVTNSLGSLTSADAPLTVAIPP